jgi:hypothetical protein
MTSLQERYSELLALTKLYLLQEHTITDRILSEPEAYRYFRSYAMRQQELKSPLPEKSFIEGSPQSRPLAQVPIISPSLKREATSKHSQPMEAGSAGDMPQPLSSIREDHPAPKIKASTPQAPKTPPALKDGALFTLEPPLPLNPIDFADLRKIINEKLPQLRVWDQIPDDTEAKELAKLWTQEKKTPPVLILSFDETAMHQAFLANIAKTLKVYGIQAGVANAVKLEQDNKWNEILNSTELKLVIASSSGFYKLVELQKNYREGTKQGRHYLGDRLLLLLSDISFYFKEPTLKPSLWGALKELLPNIFTTS